MELTDTHCHIHEASALRKLTTETKVRYERAGAPLPDDMITAAIADNVTRMICVGTTLDDSEIAVEFAHSRKAVWASIGLHPHEAKDYAGNRRDLKRFAALASQPKVVAVGECGLDYYYGHSLPADQETVLRFQIELALEHNLAMIFHVRDAFDDFWPIFDDYQRVRGVIHSFSAGRRELDQILERGLYVGLNGIMTFTNREEQLQAAKAVPLNKLLLETDAPFLTPDPYRGRICEPKHIRVTAEFLSRLRGESLQQLAARTTENAQCIFGLR
ncbi:MAG TPA: TatD family hydrolase [Candidatus Saccharimonadales bacterium]|nr:TatD family hydrolase [Candidatus Saccharimonadales bacterium]